MLNIALVIIGISIFGYSLYVLAKFLGLVKATPLGKWWAVLLVLVVFFALGYVVFAYWLVMGTQTIGLDLLVTLVSFVFFFGAIFVAITISLIYSTVTDLTKGRGEIQQLQVERIGLLQNKEAELEAKIRDKTKELEEARTNLEAKVREQTATLQEKLAQVEELNKVMVGRELKMAEMKKEIEALRQAQGKN